MISNSILKGSLAVIIISTLLSYQNVNSATYDSSEKQNSNLLIPLDINSIESFSESDLMMQSLTGNKNEKYLEILELIKNKKNEDAQSKITALLKEYPNESSYYNLQALLATVKKNTDFAIKNYYKALKLNHKNLWAYLGIAKLIFEKGDIYQAKIYADKALALNDKSSYAYFLLADMAYRQNKQQEAENLLLTAKNKSQGNFNQEIAVANNLGKLYMLKKQPKKILLLAKELTNRYPDESYALSFMANAQLVNHQNELAEQTLRKLINQNKQDVQHRLILANLLINKKEKKYIFKLLNEISSISPDKPTILIQKSAFLIKLKHYKEALIIAEKLKKIAPQTGFSQLIQGGVYLSEKKLDQALTAYRQAYKIKSTKKILFLIVDILISKGNQSTAIKLLNNEIKKNNISQALHFKLATIYQNQKNNTEAYKQYNAVLDLNPNNILALNNLAWLYFKNNKPQALVLAEKAYKLVPNSTAVADTYGSVLVKQGGLKRGITVLKKAVESAPSAYNIQYHLAHAYFSNGNTKQAIEILNRLLKSEQRFTERNKAQVLLEKLMSK